MPFLLTSKETDVDPDIAISLYYSTLALTLNLEISILFPVCVLLYSPQSPVLFAN